MRGLAGLALILVIVLVSLSAYLRLAHSGIGCADWPECYGNIGVIQSTDSKSPDEIFEQSSEVSAPLATKAHRLVATVLGLLVVFLFVWAVKIKRHRLLMSAVLGLTMFLAMLGLRSGGLHDPAVVMGNLGGGFTMLGLLGWLWFRITATNQPPMTLRLSPWFLGVVLVALVAQIFLGGLTSANFAANSCTTLPDCHGSWWPGSELLTAMDLGRTHEVTTSGQAIGGAERLAIHKAHRIGAIVASTFLVLTGLLAIKTPGRSRITGALLLVLLMIEFVIGVTSVLQGLPIWLAVSHNWVAALLLLVLLRMLSDTVNSNKTNKIQA